MKKIIKIFIVIIAIAVTEVYAEDYKIKELIPLNTKTTIHADHFNYIEMYTDQKNIYFNSILNLSNEERSISISIGLFDKKGKNIGTINNCDLILKSKEQSSYTIEIKKDYFGKDKTNKDIKYIAVLGENLNCRKTGAKDYIGKSVDELGVIHKEEFTNDTSIAIMIFSVLGGILLLMFLYKLFFTNRYLNIDGKAVRDVYRNDKK